MAVRRGSGGVEDRVLSQLLSELDGIVPLNNVTVVAATNRPDVLDDALLRPGRLDRLIYVGVPSKEGRLDILKIHLRKTPLAPDVDLQELADLTEGYSGAELASVCREGGLNAMRDNLEAAEVTRGHLLKAVGAVDRQITPDVLEFYRNFQKNAKSL
eukprot:TRINITY_DN2380_c0_g1_i1.p1 TRINITY_DN2380_c0_g1~~TRINITY_DN2380_c0_g1_i1.p1  ORF type:complete len:157 (+),score=36.90 TRINITY_DN2380_c0_g1_i1:298-768(+)